MLADAVAIIGTMDLVFGYAFLLMLTDTSPTDEPVFYSEVDR